VITPAYNRASVSLYMRYQMLPRQPVYAASAPTETVARTLGSKARAGLDVEDAENSLAERTRLDRLHRIALGFPSGWHNEFFFKVLKSRCLVFKKNGRPVGYAFVRPDGRIGPLVVRSASSFAGAFDLTLRAAVEGKPEKVTMYFPGSNGGAVRMGIEHGFRITYPMLFLSSRPMGDFENYLLYSGGLM
jgi:hypothetical protein